MTDFGYEPFIRSVYLMRDRIADATRYPFNLPAVRNLNVLPIHPCVTFLVGENGSGKSTLIEAMAVELGFNAEGGGRNFMFSTRASHSSLHEVLRFDRGRGIRKPTDGFFLRAESYYNLATNIEELDREGSAKIPPLIKSYGGKSLHEQSHGESFFALLNNRLRGDGIYIMDEPEAALSPTRQMAALSIIHQLVVDGSQLIIATHSPILMAYPHAIIYELTNDAIRPVAYKDTEHYRITSSFLSRTDKMLEILLSDGTDQGELFK